MPANNTIQSSALPVGYTLRDIYTIQSVLGQGGFGITYLAEEDVTERRVVIKENYPSAYSLRHTGSLTAAADGTANLEFYDWALNSFLNEAKVLTRLKHPHIVPVLAAFKALGTAYYVMDHINGKPLHECAPPANSMTEDWLLPVLRKLLEALDYIHSQNLLHRDIKPANILMTPEGEPILIDFGAARHIIATHTHSRVGTPGYSPPEQMSTKATPGPWTDFYALAATCYRLITGENPPDFTDRMLYDPSTALLAPRTELHRRFSPALLSSIDKAFALNPAERWQSAKEWLDALNTTTETLPKTYLPTIHPPQTVTPPEPTVLPHLSRDEARLLLLEQNITPDKYDNKLIKCAEEGKTELVSLLIDAGADINAAGKYGRTPLYMVAQNGRSECLKLLLAAGADVNMADKDGSTPLYMAAFNSHSECVKLLLAAPDIDTSRWSNLSLAVIENNIGKLRQLLATYANDVNKADKVGKTPLSWAALNGHSECVKRLLATPGIDVNKANDSDCTPLYWAAASGSSECVKLLIAAGADVNKADEWGHAPLFGAAWNGRSECVKLLLAVRGIDVNKADIGGHTPIMATGHIECVKLLIAAGADVNKANADGWTPLHWATRYDRSECVKLLLTAPGIDVNKKNKKYQCPLYLAASDGRIELVKLLLTAPGIDVNTSGMEGRTPLSIAAYRGHSECVKLLLAAPGIKVNYSDFSGKTPLSIAAYRGHSECVKLLLAAPGIKVNYSDFSGKTPFMLAVEKGHSECVKLLKAAGGKRGGLGGFLDSIFG